MHGPRRILIPILVILALAAVGYWFYIQAQRAQASGPLAASGTVEAAEVAAAPEVAGRVVEIFAAEGDSVQAGDPLFRLDDELIQAQRKRLIAALDTASAVRESAQQALEFAKASRDLARAALEIARAGVDAAQVQYEITVQSAHTAEQPSRSEAWERDFPSEFSQPTWYFGKDEEIAAARAEVDAAQAVLDAERENYASLLSESENQSLKEAEDRLSNAQAAFLVVQDVLDQAQAQPDQEVRDNAQTLYDAAESELEAAQSDYERLLSSDDAEQVLEGRARLAVANERLQTARDRLDQILTGDDALQVRAASITCRQAEAAAAQAEAALKQAEVGIAQAEAGLDQAGRAVAQAQAELDAIDAQLKKYTVLAPTSGVVTSRPVEPGEVVQAGTPVLAISQLDRLTITVYLPEDRYGQVRLGAWAQVTVDSYPGETFTASVTRIADRAEYTPRNVQTEEGRRSTVFAIELLVENPQGSLKPGMPADVVFDR